MKKTKYVLLFTALFASSLFAQEADDGFVVPLNEDFSNSVTSSPAAATTPAGGGLAIKQGAWIEVTSSNKALIRDIATGKKKGYEFDSSHFLTKMNWWFWGDITPKFHLDAEISVWDCDKTLYQANSYADNVPDVTWGDGLQTLVSTPFSFLYNLNDNGIGAFNKMGFTIINPYFQAKFGHGKLKANGMLDFNGIYHVIDRWDYVEKGFTEVSLGKNLQKAGDFTIDATCALSMMRGTYGTYDLLDVKYGDSKNPLFEGALTFGSYTTKEELFRYNEKNINAASAYFAVNPIEPLKIEAHTIGTFGTDVKLNKDSLALAGRIGWKKENWNIRATESYAAKKVDSVWGCDGTDYDNINANTSTTRLEFQVAPVSLLSFGLDEAATYILEDEDEASKHNQFRGFTSFRTQPYFDFNLKDALSKDITVGLYGVVDFDKLTDNTKDDSSLKTNFREAGIELKMGDVVPKVKKLTFDYAISANAKWQMDSTKLDSNNSYDLGEMFHSIMLVADLNDNFSLTAASLYRQYVADVKSSFVDQPLGFALGFAINKIPLPGKPKFWAHFIYGMDPYEDKNYELYRADNPQKKALHRTYLLNTLDDTTTDVNTSSYFCFGLIWDLK